MNCSVTWEERPRHLQQEKKVGIKRLKISISLAIEFHDLALQPIALIQVVKLTIVVRGREYSRLAVALAIMHSAGYALPP
jgi:hypothetical protein